MALFWEIKWEMGLFLKSKFIDYDLHGSRPLKGRLP